MNLEDYLEHHGIQGQKWGKQHGPPYPLNPASDYSAEQQLENHVTRKNPSGDNGKSYKQEHASYRGEPRETFRNKAAKKYDRDGDGKVSIAEREAYLKDRLDQGEARYQAKARNFSENKKKFISDTLHTMANRSFRTKMSELRSGVKVRDTFEGAEAARKANIDAFNEGKISLQELKEKNSNVGSPDYEGTKYSSLDKGAKQETQGYRFATDAENRAYAIREAEQRGLQKAAQGLMDEYTSVALGEKKLKDVNYKKIAETSAKGSLAMPATLAGEQLITKAVRSTELGRKALQNQWGSMGVTSLAIAAGSTAVQLGETAVNATLHPEKYKNSNRKNAYSALGLGLGSTALALMGANMINKGYGKLREATVKGAKKLYSNASAKYAGTKAYDALNKASMKVLSSKPVALIKKHPNIARGALAVAAAIGITEYALARGRNYKKKEEQRNRRNERYSTTPQSNRSNIDYNNRIERYNE